MNWIFDLAALALLLKPLSDPAALALSLFSAAWFIGIDPAALALCLFSAAWFIDSAALTPSFVSAAWFILDLTIVGTLEPEEAGLYYKRSSYLLDRNFSSKLIK